MSIPSSGSSTCRRASTTSSFVGTKASLATAARRAAGLRGRVEVGAGPRIAGERRAAELRHDEAHRVELDLVPARRRRAVPLEQVVASAALDEEQVSGGLRRRRHSGGLGLGERLREPCTAAFELARPELLTGRCGLRRLGTTLDVVSRPDELLDPARLLMRLALGVAEPLDLLEPLTKTGPRLVDADQRLVLALQLTDPPPELFRARRHVVALALDLLEPPPKTRTRLLDADQRLVFALQLTNPPPELFRTR